MTTPPKVGPPPPFDSELAAGLAAMGIDPQVGWKLPDSRDQQLTVSKADLREFARDGRFVVEERGVPGPQGAPDISLLICRPSSATTLRPIVYYIHGGGMIIGNNQTGVSSVLDWAEEFELTVVSVEYRLAPAHPHPAPFEDCRAGLVWTVEHAAEIGGDPERVIIAGTSAGAGLAASVTLHIRDHGGPALLGQMLLCPMLDDRNNSPSSVQMEGIGVWDRAHNGLGWAALLGDEVGGPNVSPYASPARETDLSNLPPTFIDVGSAETFRDESVQYALTLWRSGGRAELHVWPGGFHGYEFFSPKASVSQDTLAARSRWLHRLLNV